MQSPYKKILLFLFSIIFTISALGVGTASAVAAPGYVWSTRTTITAPDGEVWYSGNDSYLQKVWPGGSTSNYAFTCDRFLKLKESGQTPTFGCSIGIKPETPLTGTRLDAGGSSLNTPIAIVLTDPRGVAPQPIQLITKGWVTGRVIPDPSILPANQELMVKGKVMLMHDGKQVYIDTGAFIFGQDNLRSIYKDPPDKATFFYNGINIAAIPLDQSNSTFGLYPGVYQLAYNYSEGTSCASGEMRPGANDLSQLACTGTLSSTVDFQLDRQSDGSAKVTILNGDNAENNSPANGNILSTTPDKTKGIDMFVTFALTSPIDGALSSAIRTMASFVQKATEWSMGQIRGLLDSTADYVVGPIGSTAGGVSEPWLAMRNIALTLLVIALVIIAFANALQIDIEQYGLNRMIPKIIISIIMAFASWIIVVFLFDFTKALQDQAVGLIGGTNGLEAIGKLTLNVPSATDIAAKIGAVILLLVLFFAVLICGIVLLFMLLMRVVMLSFLLVVAPLAFIMNIVPFASGLYKQWWAEFWKWMFMGPVAMIIIALGSVIAASTSKATFGVTTTLDASMLSGTAGTGGNILIGLLIFAASLYAAATLPIQWGGKIMQNFIKGSKTFASKGLGNIGGKYSANRMIQKGQSWLGTRKAQQDAANNVQLARWQDKVANSGVVGAKWAATGVTGASADAVAKNLHTAAVAQHAKLLNMDDPDTTKDALVEFGNEKYGAYTNEASAGALIRRKILDADKEENERLGGNAGEGKQEIFDKFAGSPGMRALAFANQKDLILGSNSPDIPTDLKIKASKSFQDKDISAIGSGEIEAMIKTTMVPEYTPAELAAAKEKAKTTNQLSKIPTRPGAATEEEMVLADINKETLNRVSRVKLAELEKKKGTKGIDALAKYALTQRGQLVLDDGTKNELAKMRPDFFSHGPGGAVDFTTPSATLQDEAIKDAKKWDDSH